MYFNSIYGMKRFQLDIMFFNTPILHFLIRIPKSEIAVIAYASAA